MFTIVEARLKGMQSRWSKCDANRFSSAWGRYHQPHACQHSMQTTPAEGLEGIPRICAGAAAPVIGLRLIISILFGGGSLLHSILPMEMRAMGSLHRLPLTAIHRQA
jgi:hypothetical protein